MFNATKVNASRHRTSGLRVGVVLFAAVIVLLPISANAQCSRTWDASGEWEIHQGSGPRATVMRLNLTQSGNALSGTASRGGTSSKVEGEADGDNFRLWFNVANSNELLIYAAQVSASGKLAGETYIGSTKRNRDTWYSDQPLTCGWSPGKSRGNLTSRLSANAPVQPGSAAGYLAKGPILVASQPVFPLPSNPVGWFVLTWDAGPAHPNADVWVKYGNSREKVLVMKQPKGGQQIVLQRGQMYTYVLMDDRLVLATTTFVAY
ncbi:MAG TPA: hypothetical protein VGO43_12240 [Pyrinomonadaceae bacterium]|nr:hypothetical protein [Pyrinomonadaceae bacterium]